MTNRVDNGTELTSKATHQGAYSPGVQFDFSRPRKPTSNKLVEAFKGRLRAECLNENLFVSLEDIGERFEAWRTNCKERRPQSPPEKPGSQGMRFNLPGETGKLKRRFLP